MNDRGVSDSTVYELLEAKFGKAGGFYEPVIVSVWDYFPFGMLQPVKSIGMGLILRKMKSTELDISTQLSSNKTS